ncbi:hypothetical protein [Pricia sp.]|uniref:hypothetical protein n=1 Tax=Pricia sp. TaxID=2268138 RepID=UPI00359354BB
MPFFLYSQLNQENKKYYNWFDQQIGTQNLQIYKGTAYVEEYRTINEKHKFFKTSEFLPGSINYEGQPYYELQLKYDSYEDVLLINSKNGKGTVLRLNSAKIKNFVIDAHKFINTDRGIQEANEVSGFYEVLLETSSFTLLKKNKKNILKKIRSELVYYEFKSDIEIYLNYKGKYYPIPKKRDLIRIFPEFKKNINAYYNTASDNTDTEYFMKSLLKNIELELSKQNGAAE